VGFYVSGRKSAPLHCCGAAGHHRIRRDISYNNRSCGYNCSSTNAHATQHDRAKPNPNIRPRRSRTRPGRVRYNCRPQSRGMAHTPTNHTQS